MVLDQTANFVRVKVSGTHNSTETTISLASGDASEVPDPANGEYNLVWWDDANNLSPATDTEVEIVRVTGRDTTNDTITVQRGQEGTTAVAHDTADATYRMILSNTSKMVSDVDTSLQGKVDGTSVNEAIADTAANLPVAGTADRLFFETDTGRTLYDNGTSWVEVGLSESQISGANINSNTVTVANNSVSLGGSTTVATSDLSDQTITTPSAGQTILYDATNSQFVNAAITASDGLASTGGDGSFTLDVDIGGQTNVTAASTDEVLIEDASDAGNTKKTTAQSIADLGGGVAVPIGGIIPFHKDKTGTPALPPEYVECNGQTINDTESPYDGSTAPNLNGNNQFLRGNSISGGTGGASSISLSTSEMPSHTHDYTRQGATGPYGGGNYDYTDNNDDTLATQSTGGDGAHENRPPYFDTVMIMRIK